MIHVHPRASMRHLNRPSFNSDRRTNDGHLFLDTHERSHSCAFVQFLFKVGPACQSLNSLATHQGKRMACPLSFRRRHRFYGAWWLWVSNDLSAVCHYRTIQRYFESRASHFLPCSWADLSRENKSPVCIVGTYAEPDYKLDSWQMWLRSWCTYLWCKDRLGLVRGKLIYWSHYHTSNTFQIPSKASSFCRLSCSLMMPPH